MNRIIGETTRYTGAPDTMLPGARVVIVAVKTAAGGPDAPALRDDEAIAAAGGVKLVDRVEVRPIGCRFTTCDPLAGDLALFASERPELVTCRGCSTRGVPTTEGAPITSCHPTIIDGLCVECATT